MEGERERHAALLRYARVYLLSLFFSPSFDAIPLIKYHARMREGRQGHLIISSRSTATIGYVSQIGKLLVTRKVTRMLNFNFTSNRNISMPCKIFLFALCFVRFIKVKKRI